MHNQSNSFNWQNFIKLSLLLTFVSLLEWSMGFLWLTFALAVLFFSGANQFAKWLGLFYLSFLVATLFLINWPLMLVFFLLIDWLANLFQRHHLRYSLILASLISSLGFIVLARLQLRPSLILLMVLEIFAFVIFLPVGVTHD